MGDEGTGAGVRGVSGGERKRVTVGVGLVTQPKVLLLTNAPSSPHTERERERERDITSLPAT